MGRKPFKWFGGKGKMVKHLLPMIPPHTIYVEGFGGSAALLFAKAESPKEVYNDIDSTLVNFFRVLRDERKFQRLLYLLENTPFSREEFYSIKGKHIMPDQDEVMWAYRFFYIASSCRNGIVYPNPFWFTTGNQTPTTDEAPDYYQRQIENLKWVRERFKRVYVEHLDFQTLVEMYDSPDTFFYMDPPYLKEKRRANKSGFAEDSMSQEDHIRLLNTLKRTKGKVLLSGYPSELYDQMLLPKGWNKREFQVKVPSSNIRLKYYDVPNTVECVWFNYQLHTLSLEQLWRTEEQDETTRSAEK